MRVLVTADAVGGVWQYVLELARGLEGQGVRLGLAVMGARLAPDQREEAAELRNVTVYHRPYRLEWMNGSEADLAESSDWLLAIASRFDPDVVHVNGYFHAALPWKRPVVLVAHSCVCSWWEAVHGEPAPRSWDPYRSRVKRGLRAADLVVAPSRSMLQSLESHHGPLGEARVVYNGRDLAAPLGRWKDPIVLGAGRVWDRAKNLGALAQLAPRLEWPVLIAGEAAHPDGGSPERSSSNGARYLGRLSNPEMEEWMRRASIYCLPARYEPFGLTALEAALSECALVLSDIPTFRELWRGAAELVPPDDAGALHASVSRLIRDERLRRRRSRAAFERAQKLGRREMARAYLSIYERLSRNRRRRRRIPGDTPSMVRVTRRTAR